MAWCGVACNDKATSAEARISGDPIRSPTAATDDGRPASGPQTKLRSALATGAYVSARPLSLYFRLRLRLRPSSIITCAPTNSKLAIIIAPSRPPHSDSSCPTCRATMVVTTS